MILLALAACSSVISEVTLYGTVADQPNQLGSALADVTLRSYEDDGVTEHADTTSDADGIFYLPVPAGVNFFVTLEKDGYTTTSFSSVSPVEDFYAGDGLPWIVSEDWTASLRQTWEGCPGADGSDTIVVGEVRYPLGISDVPQDNPLWPGVTVTFEDSAFTTHDACYLGEDLVVDADLTETSSSGAWAFFGVPSGPGTVLVTVPTDDGTATEIYEESVPAGGLVGMYPVFSPDT